MTNPADDFLTGGSGVKSASFPQHGASVTGTITEPPQVKQQTDLQGKPKTWDNSDPMMHLVVTLQTQEKTDQEDDGRRRVYVKGSKDPASQSLTAAVSAAVQAAGAKGLEVGGTLTVTYVADGVARAVGFNAPKKYTAKYSRPSGDQFLAAPAPGAARPVTAAAAPGPVGLNETQLAALRAAGIDPASLATASA